MTKELIENVQKWAKDRGILEGDGHKQGLYLISEFGELVDSCLKDNRDGVLDAIGDMLVVMIIYSHQTQLYAPFSAWLNSESAGLMYDLERTLYSLKSVVNGLVVHEKVNPLNENPLSRKEREDNLNIVICTLAKLATHYDSTLHECLILAYEEIKDRKGKTVDGVFVKEV